MKVRAKKLRPAGFGRQFVSIVHRGAARKVWKVLKSEDGMAKACDNAECTDPNCPVHGDAAKAAKTEHGDPKMYDRLIARKAVLDRMIEGLHDDVVGGLAATLAQKGSSLGAVHTFLLDAGAYSVDEAQAWAEARDFTVAKAETLDGRHQLQVHPSDPGEREFLPIEVAKGVDAIVFVDPPDPAEALAQKTAVLDVFDSARAELLASIATATPDTVRKLLGEAALEIARKLGGAAEEGMDDMTTEELAKKVDGIEATLKTVATAEQVAEIVKKAIEESPKPEVATKADLQPILDEAIATATKAIEEKLAPLTAGVDEAKKAIAELTPRVERAERTVPARQGLARERGAALEAPIVETRKGDGVFDSAFPWGRRASA